MEPNWFVAWPVVVAPGFRLPDAPRRVRVFPAEDRHVTAVFLGACGEAAARRVFASAAALPAPNARATFGPVEALGNPARPSALSALVAEGREALAEIIADHRADWLAQAGRRPDTRPPLPHCTLARAQRRATEAERVAAVNWGRQLETNGVTLEVRPLALYTWAEDRRERLFQIVDQAAPLRRGEADPPPGSGDADR
ncbi:MAG: 2'-5' RNA ligase family protein [Myxococcota bacterium]